MKVQRCDKGHYYDSDLYASCPHCPGSTEKVKSTVRTAAVPDKEEKDRKRIFDFLRKKSSEEEKASVSEPERGYACEATKVLVQPVAEKPAADKSVNAVKSADKTEQPVAGTGSQNEYKEIKREVPQNIYAAELTEEHKAGTAQQPKAEQKTFVCPETTGWFSAGTKESEPCVGWLTGVTGPYRGRSFELKAGGNFIGRAPGNDIVLSDDNRVSRQRHARVAYEPKSREFYIEVGESNGLAYLNGGNILHHAALTAGDIIEIGGGTYIFVPLCSQNFSWDAHPALNPICRGQVLRGEVSQ